MNGLIHAVGLAALIVIGRAIPGFILDLVQVFAQWVRKNRGLTPPREIES